MGDSRPQEATDTLSAAYNTFNRVARNPRGAFRTGPRSGRGSRGTTPASEDEFSSPEPRRRDRRSASPAVVRSRRRRSPSMEEVRPRARRGPASVPRSPDGYDRLGRIVDVLARQSAAERVLGPGANGPRSFWDDVSGLYRYVVLLLRFGMVC